MFLLLSEQPDVVLVVMVLEIVPVWSTAQWQFVSGQGAFKDEKWKELWFNTVKAFISLQCSDNFAHSEGRDGVSSFKIWKVTNGYYCFRLTKMWTLKRVSGRRDYSPAASDIPTQPWTFHLSSLHFLRPFHTGSFGTETNDHNICPFVSALCYQLLPLTWVMTGF